MGVKKVKCIDNTGLEPYLTFGRLYDVLKENDSVHGTAYTIRHNAGGESAFKGTRFVVVNVVKVMCIDAFKGSAPNGALTFQLAQRGVYEAIDLRNGGYEIITPLSPTWRPYFRAIRFVVVDGAATTLPSMKAANTVDVDPEESRLVAILTRPVADRFTCQRCAAPLPCKWHELPSSCK